MSNEPRPNRRREQRLLVLVTALLIVVAFLLVERFGYIQLAPSPRAAEVMPDGSNGLIGGTVTRGPRVPVEDMGLHSVAQTAPDTPAGQRLTWALSRMNLHSNTFTTDEIVENFSPTLLAELPAEELRTELARISASNAPLVLVGFVEPPTDTHLVGVVAVPGNRYRTVTVTVEAEPPHALTELVLRTF